MEGPAPVDIRRAYARRAGRNQEAWSRGLEEIPPIAEGIDEDGNGSVDLMAGRLEERDACGKHGGVIAAEVVGKEKEADPPAGLIADCGALPFALGPGEQESGLRRTFRPHDDPALAAAEVAVIEEVEAELAAVKGDALVVAGHDDGDTGNRLSHCRSAPSLARSTDEADAPV